MAETNQNEEPRWERREREHDEREKAHLALCEREAQRLALESEVRALEIQRMQAHRAAVEAAFERQNGILERIASALEARAKVG